MPSPLHLAVDLDRPSPDLVHAAERGLLDLVTVAGGPQTLAAGAGSPTGRIGLVASVPTTGTDPGRIAADLAGLDDASGGRAGWLVPTPVGADDAVPGGGHPWSVTPAARARFAARLDETADAVDAVRRRWDSAGREPLPVVTSGHGWETFRLAARVADVVLTTPADAFGAALLVEQIRDAERSVGRTGAELRILADLVVLLDDTERAARDRLDEVDGAYPDAVVVATSPSALADMMVAWQRIGMDGFRLRPAAVSDDLHRIVDELVPALVRRGAFRTGYRESTLRPRLTPTTAGSRRWSTASVGTSA